MTERSLLEIALQRLETSDLSRHSDHIAFARFARRQLAATTRPALAVHDTVPDPVLASSE